MLNQTIIAGILTSDPVIEKKEGKEFTVITIAVPRAYKNADGVYETDFIDCIVWNAIADNVVEYCRKGDIVGVKGRLQTTILEDKKYTEVIAEKITFLSSKKED